MKVMHDVADTFVENLKQIDKIHIIESIERGDTRSNKLIDELLEKDELQGKINRNIRT
jgi:hypothetical protein